MGVVAAMYLGWQETNSRQTSLFSLNELAPKGWGRAKSMDGQLARKQKQQGCTELGESSLPLVGTVLFWILATYGDTNSAYRSRKRATLVLISKK